MKKKLKIPKSPIKEKKSYKRKVRRSWKVNPVEKVKPNTKKKEDRWNPRTWEREDT